MATRCGTATGFAWFGQISPDGAFPTDVLGPSIVASVSFGLCLAPLVSAATVGFARHETGTASALPNSSRQIGASLGPAALGTAAQHRTGDHATSESLGDGYALGLTLCAGLLAAAVLIALTVLRKTNPTGSNQTGSNQTGAVERAERQAPVVPSPTAD